MSALPMDVGNPIAIVIAEAQAVMDAQNRMLDSVAEVADTTLDVLYGNLGKAIAALKQRAEEIKSA